MWVRSGPELRIKAHRTSPSEEIKNSLIKKPLCKDLFSAKVPV